jgi:hypothetical protein
MSETQNEYETENETDAEPTPGPWRTWQAGEDPLINEECVLAEHPDKQEPLLVAEMNRTANDHTDFPGHWKANARLIAAAGTAAQEAKEMGYDPQKAVEALPVGLEQARCAIIDLLDGPPGETSAPAVKSAIKRLAFFLGEASNEEVSEIVDDKMLNDALASAEGSDQ